MRFLKSNRHIKYGVIHTSDTYENQDIGAEDIDRWHRTDPDKKFRMIGYHGVITRNGTYEFGRDLSEIGAHVKGFNSNSIGICLVGGKDLDDKPIDNYTSFQWDTLERVVRGFSLLFPGIKWVGHNELDPNKTCPNFDVQAWLQRIDSIEAAKRLMDMAY